MVNRFTRCHSWRSVVLIFLCGLSIYLLIITYGENRKLENYWSEQNPNHNLRNNTVGNEIGDDAFPVVEVEYVDIVVLFTKTEENTAIQMKFGKFVNSLFTGASIPVALHIVGDAASHEIAAKIIKKQVKLPIEKIRKYKYKIINHEFNKMIEGLDDLVSNMQLHFSYKPGAYYSDALFFVSLALHKIFNKPKVIMLDVDVHILGDIHDLYKQFDKFSSTALIGIAYEQQPVYRHVFQLHRATHKNTTIGNPPIENGFPGFNSGVLLLNLDRMRTSHVYNDLLNANVIDSLANKYQFKGHLGDQDFFTLIALDHSELFHVLSCGWNRQLCQWWRNNGYQDVFDLFYKCDKPVQLYHGNCNTLIPVQ